jgi:hypothetical protein
MKRFLHILALYRYKLRWGPQNCQFIGAPEGLNSALHRVSVLGFLKKDSRLKIMRGIYGAIEVTLKNKNFLTLINFCPTLTSSYVAHHTRSVDAC